MNTPSKEAREAAAEWQGEDCPMLSAIIDRYFEPLRKRLAEMESLLESEKATRNSIIAKGQQAEARVKELAGALRNIIEIVREDGSDERYDRAIAREAEIVLDPSLARHAAGEPEAQT